ncbi:hypothetical protein ACJMK2_040898 [Sinanodonta woodiana]|uniref:Zinc finger FYVE domain-containing protein n=1 Tax=Sinanodonta woodiana TaxID=1069815 RepID=A0ABD3W655_SINWO
MDSLIVDLDKVLDDFEAEEKKQAFVPGQEIKPSGFSEYLQQQDDRTWKILSDLPSLESCLPVDFGDKSVNTNIMYDLPYEPAEKFDMSEADFAPSPTPKETRYSGTDIYSSSSDFHKDIDKSETDKSDEIGKDFNAKNMQNGQFSFYEKEGKLYVGMHEDDTLKYPIQASDLYSPDIGACMASQLFMQNGIMNESNNSTGESKHIKDNVKANVIIEQESAKKGPVSSVIGENKSMVNSLGSLGEIVLLSDVDSVSGRNKDAISVHGVYDGQIRASLPSNDQVIHKDVPAKTDHVGNSEGQSRISHSFQSHSQRMKPISPILVGSDSENKDIAQSCDRQTENKSRLHSEITQNDHKQNEAANQQPTSEEDSLDQQNSTYVDAPVMIIRKTTEMPVETEVVTGFGDIAEVDGNIQEITEYFKEGTLDGDSKTGEIISVIDKVYLDKENNGNLQTCNVPNLQPSCENVNPEPSCVSDSIVQIDSCGYFVIQTEAGPQLSVNPECEIVEDDLEILKALPIGKLPVPIDACDKSSAVHTSDTFISNLPPIGNVPSGVHSSEVSHANVSKRIRIEFQEGGKSNFSVEKAYLSSSPETSSGAKTKELQAKTNRPQTLLGLSTPTLNTDTETVYRTMEESTVHSHCNNAMDSTYALLGNLDLNGEARDIHIQQELLHPKMKQIQTNLEIKQEFEREKQQRMESSDQVRDQGNYNNESFAGSNQQQNSDLQVNSNSVSQAVLSSSEATSERDLNFSQEHVILRRPHLQGEGQSSTENFPSMVIPSRPHSWGPSESGQPPVQKQKRPTSLNLPPRPAFNIDADDKTSPEEVGASGVSADAQEVSETCTGSQDFTPAGEVAGAEAASIPDPLLMEPPPPYSATIGQVAPIWIPDAETQTCMSCESKFTFTKRRHHCRACGKVFCSNCCNLRTKLQYMDFREARVCHHCYEEITRGTSRRAEPKQVIFSDGIRPGGDLTELDGFAEVQRLPIRRTTRLQKKLERSPPDGQSSPRARRLKIIENRRSRCLIPDDGLPPIVIPGETPYDSALISNPDPEMYMSQITNEEADPAVFAVNTNLHVLVKVVNLDCCVNRVCWCFTSRGLCSVGQEEIVIVLEMLQEEKFPPRDIFCHFNNIFEDASKGNTVTDSSHTLFNQSFLDSRDHGGFLYIRSTFQCLQKLMLPSPPFIFGILLQKWETPWAKVFPIRLILRLGAEYRYYPCPLISARNRKPVFFEIGHTIMNLLADFRNFQYMLPHIRGVTIHMEDKRTMINFPKNRYEELMKVVNNSNEHVMAMGANFSPDADSHLVCIQNDDGNYQTQAINIQNKPRKVTGASFVVFNGALKSSSGLTAKSSIVEDGLMVQITPDSMLALKQAMKDMQDYTIACGIISAAKPEETVYVRWVDDDKNVNIGVKSPIDNMKMDGVNSIYIHKSTDYIGDRCFIRWTEVFFIDTEERASGKSEPVDLSRLAETLASACCIALTPHLEKLQESSLTRVGLRVTIDSERVGYQVGSNGSCLSDQYMNDLDNELIPVIHSIAQQNHEGAIVLELIFHIMDC